MKQITKNQLAQFWIDNFSDGHCTLCGNHGVIDTRKVKIANGKVIGRLNWCICPNGRAIKKAVAREPVEKDLR